MLLVLAAHSNDPVFQVPVWSELSLCFEKNLEMFRGTQFNQTDNKLRLKSSNAELTFGRNCLIIIIFL